ncbi:hypothetical protein [Dolichospermum circinale]|uniref:hypothetical protein n=1 Tax=Dolichospermum circinale TaxID=109265 RepID=UPI00232C7E27|nr:hypothetical protein [Dolichospermum circinale]
MPINLNYHVNVRIYAKYLSKPLSFVIFAPIPDGTLRERGSLVRNLWVIPKCA